MFPRRWAMPTYPCVPLNGRFSKMTPPQPSPPKATPWISFSKACVVWRPN